MKDKNYDSFFDENPEEQNKQDALLALVEEHTVPLKMNAARGKKVTGTVVRIGFEYLFIDIGTKNEAVMSRAEYLAEDGTVTCALGDTITAFVISTNDSETILSKSMGTSGGTSDLIDAMKGSIPVMGKVSAVNKGGLTVTLMGKRAFCPISQIDLKFVDDVNVYLGKSFPFIIQRVTEGGNNVVVSRVPVLERELSEQIQKLNADIESQKVFEGKITRIAPFGLFVDIGPLEGLVHISEVSWDRTEKLETLYSVGQRLSCIILSIDLKTPVRDSKVSLSMRKVMGDPWSVIHQTFQVGQSVAGHVTRLADFGAFVRLTSGIEGLVHISEMTWGKRIHHPKEVVLEGADVMVTILAIDTDKKTISLTLKDETADPWKEAETTYRTGTVHTGTVTGQARFGFFLDLSFGISGLLLHQNIDPAKKDAVKIGATIEVTVESFDSAQRRIGLSYGKREVQQNEAEVAELLSKLESEKKVSTQEASEFGSALLAAMNKKN